MPTYDYVCAACGHRETHITRIADRDTMFFHMECKVEPGIIMPRDVVGSMPRETTEQEYDQPIYSDALGVHPSQIPDAQKKFPHHEFLGDGRMVIRSHTQRKRVLKELGMRDWDSYS
jgi:hypothetical protein